MRSSGKASNYGRIIREICRQRRKFFVVPDGKIIESSVKIVGEIESERSIAVSHIINHSDSDKGV
jgi:hypothetical protein